MMKKYEGHLWLSDIFDIEKPEFGSNNLILAPVGSGKTTLIKERLAKDVEGVILMLVSNNFLKDSTSPQDIEEKKRRGERTYTTQHREVFGEGKHKIYTMSFAEFGERISLNDYCFKDVSQIHCDEIHSLPEYKSYGNNDGLTHAIRYLFNPQEGKQIFYYTATYENLRRLERMKPGTLQHVKTFNYLNYPGIVKYIELFNEKFGHINQLRIKFKEISEDFKVYGYKGLIYTKKIETMKVISEMLKEEGFNPLMLWSINNKENIMSDKQLQAREEIIKTKRIPNEYDFLIINGAMREGWDLHDERVGLVIVNSTSETDIVQVRGRVRMNIPKLIYRCEGSEVENIKIGPILDKFNVINKELNTKDKNKLVENLGIYRADGKLVRWNGVKQIIENNGFDVIDKTVKRKGKRFRVSVIKEKDVK